MLQRAWQTGAKKTKTFTDELAFAEGERDTERHRERD